MATTVEETAVTVDFSATEQPELPPPAKEDGEIAKSKAPKARKPRSASTHPPFLEMITEAIATLKERTGSSQIAITKYVEENQKQLPSNFRKLLLGHLKKLVASEKLVKVKNSYKLPSAKSAPASAPSTKPKVKPAATKPKTVAAAKSKAKTVSKPKAAAAKRKTVAAKPKSKPAAAKPTKVARTSSRTSPGKRTRSAAKPAAPAKKPVSVKSSAKKAPAKRGRK